MQRQPLVDERPERRQFAESTTNHSRTSYMDNMLTLSTSVTKIGSNSRSRNNRLQLRLISSTAQAVDRNLSAGFRKIASFRDKMNLNKAIEDRARIIYKHYVDAIGDSKVKGTTSDWLIAAAMFLAAKAHFINLVPRDVFMYVNVSRKDLTKGIKKIREKVNPKHFREAIDPVEGMITHFLTYLRMGMKVEKEAVAVYKKIGEALTGKRHSTIAATCIYFAAKKLGVEHSLDTIALVAASSTNTIETTLKTVNSVLNSGLNTVNETSSINDERPNKKRKRLF
jgi:transcription initiation factor TFIIIB Brf1 subunit/transcription initiation factor TFIIB